MEPTLVRTLQDHQTHIRARWEALLRMEPVNTPLANPDILIRLFAFTLGQVFDALRAQPMLRRSAPAPAYAAIRAACTCGRNPLLAYFLAGEQALLETLVLLEAAGHRKHDTAAAELHVTIRQIARREVETFCSLCQFRRTAAGRRRDVPDRQDAPHLRQATPYHAVSTGTCAMPT